MIENNKEKLQQFLKEFQINKGLDSSEHIELLRKLEYCPKKEVLLMLHLFLEEEKNPEVLLFLVKFLTKYNDKSSIAILTELLLWKDKFRAKSDNPNDYLKVRCAAASALGNLKDNNSVFSLLFILNSKDENYKLRFCCAEALGRIGNTYAVAPLIEVVSDEEEKSVYVRESAAKALGLLGDIRAIDSLVNILEAKQGIIDRFTFLKERIIEAIGKIGHKDNKTLKVLTDALSDDSPYIRLGAIEALAEFQDEKVFSLVEKMIDDEDEEVARGAINALYNIAGSKYLEHLLGKENLAGWCRDEIEDIFRELEEENNDIGKEIDEN